MNQLKLTSPSLTAQPCVLAGLGLFFHLRKEGLLKSGFSSGDYSLPPGFAAIRLPRFAEALAEVQGGKLPSK